MGKNWQLFHKGTPGRRFRDQYQRHHRSKASKNLFKRVLRWIGAAAALAVGVVLSVVPGPAIPFFILAGGLLAMDWLWMARTLDWGEVRARKVWARLHRFWKKLSRPAQVCLAILGACLSVATTYTFYRLLH